MFCSNCGSQIADGAKFCSNCGANLSGNPAMTQQRVSTSNQITAGSVARMSPDDAFELIRNYHNFDELTQSRIWKGVVEAGVYDTFNRRRQFGDDVYIIGKDPINQAIKDNLEGYYMSDDPEEKPLIVFDYGKNLKEGFVITNRRFVWNYSLGGQNEFEMSELQDVEVGKKLLATVMYVMTVDGVKSNAIYLTGIDDETGFVAKFRKVVHGLHNLYKYIYGGDEEDSQSYGNDEREYEPENSDFIIRACRSVRIDSIYVETGEPLTPGTSKKLGKARMNFRIPDEEEVYMIFDATVFGGCTKGFALCTHGIYYSGESGRIAFLNWQQFRNTNISLSFLNLKIGDERFTPGSDGKKIMMVLQDIQEYLR